jgi:type IX secretion system PorP/SprF family membrane protein
MRIHFTTLIFAFTVLLISKDLRAQQDPHYSQFMYNKLLFNAGYAGATDGKICVTLLNRTQWTGFGGQTVNGLAQGAAPTNLVGSINTSLVKNQRIGIGGTIARDELGFETTLVPRLTLSYRQPIGSDGNLAAGVGIGSMQRTLDGSKLKAIDPNDPKVPTEAVSGTALDFDFGLYYTKSNLLGVVDNFYAGLSATHLNQNEIRYEWGKNSTTINSSLHYYFVTGADYVLNSSFTLNPNILVKQSPGKLQTDLNCMVIWNQNIKGGLTWRPVDAVVAMVGYEFPFGLMAGYSYDLTTTKILNYSSGSHEIMVRYCFGVKIPTRNPPPVRSRYTPRFM